MYRTHTGEWIMGLETPALLAVSITHVQGIDIQKNKILVYSKGGTDVMTGTYNEAWFIIDPATKKEEGFISLKEFGKALKKMKIDTFNLKEPNRLYQEINS